MAFILCKERGMTGLADSSYLLMKTLIAFLAGFHFLSTRLVKILSKLFSKSFSSFSSLILSAYLVLFSSIYLFLSVCKTSTITFSTILDLASSTTF